MPGQTIILRGPSQRAYAKSIIDKAPQDAVVSVREAKRSNPQNDFFHTLCWQISLSGMKWAGKRRSKDEWKVLLVSAHTKATKGEVEIVEGIEGEMVNIREATSRMTVARASSLIEYTLAFCATHGIEIPDPKWMDAA